MDVPVFLLCGGLGTRLTEETETRPKPMVPIGHRPILWHVMQTYSRHGFKRFILCLGFKSEMIKSYFLNYSTLNSDFTVNLRTNDTAIHSVDHEEDWQVTLAYTGEDSMTGARIARAVDRYLGNASHFAVSYGDGLTDANLIEEFQFHQQHGKLGTVLGVNPPARFGELQLEGPNVVAFQEKPEIKDHYANGGYFFFNREFRQYLSTDASCILERDPLQNLATDGELSIFRHNGFWDCMDTPRDRNRLNAMWDKGIAPWMIQRQSLQSVDLKHYVNR